MEKYIDIEVFPGSANTSATKILKDGKNGKKSFQISKLLCLCSYCSLNNMKLGPLKLNFAKVLSRIPSHLIHNLDKRKANDENPLNPLTTWWKYNNSNEKNNIVMLYFILKYFSFEAYYTLMLSASTIKPSIILQSKNEKNTFILNSDTWTWENNIGFFSKSKSAVFILGTDRFFDMKTEVTFIDFTSFFKSKCIINVDFFKKHGLENFKYEEHIPLSINEIKYSKKYILETSLKKYEAFNPEKDTIVGILEGIPIHPKESVEKIRSKDAWLTQFGRVIRENEVPIKEVKLTKRIVNGNQIIKLQRLYGLWQTKPCERPKLIDVS